MQVELNAKELDTLDDALVAWQRQPMSDSVNKGMMSAIFGAMAKNDGIPEPEDDENSPKAIMNKAEIESRQRERQVLMLRAKLCQASAKNSEHEIQREP